MASPMPRAQNKAAKCLFTKTIHLDRLGILFIYVSASVSWAMNTSLGKKPGLDQAVHTVFADLPIPKVMAF